MDKDQIQNVTVILPDGSKKQLLVLAQVSVKTPPENKLALWEWLREHDAADIITETVNSSTLAAYVRGQMKEGEPYPAELLERRCLAPQSLAAPVFRSWSSRLAEIGPLKLDAMPVGVAARSARGTDGYNAPLVTWERPLRKWG
jgi:hypothetical protein